MQATLRDQPTCERIEFVVVSREQISKQVVEGFNRRNEEYVRNTFDSLKHSDTGLIVGTSLKSALTEVGMNFNSTEIDEVFSAGLDFQDFSSLVSTPSPIEEWVRSLPLSQLVADAMPKSDCCRCKDQLRHLSRISEHQLKDVCDVIMKHLAMIFGEELATLRAAYAKLDSHAVAEHYVKFQICKMRVGNVDDFHKGLSARIG
jgi:hypothetical protein